VSHDQDFLNSVCTDIVHLHSQKLTYYKGNYDSFKKLFTESVAQQRKDYEKQQKALKQAQIQKSKKQDSAKKVDKVKESTKVIRNRQLATNKAKSKGGQADDDQNNKDLLQRPEKDYTVAFHFPDPSELSIPIIQVDDASFGYTPDKILFHDLNFGIDMDSRIALVGPNGAGKSTLLKLLAGELSPTTGEIKINRKLILGRFSQHFVDQVENMNQTPIEYLHSLFPEYTAQELRPMLGRFGLTGQTHVQPIKSLSGGQKSRVVFAEICMKNPHLLFLDEPTNHLDIESIDALAEALNEYKGGLVLVSHDSRLISEVCNEIWVVGDNTVTIYESDFDDYRSELVGQFEEREQEEEQKRKVKEQERRQKREEDLRQREKKTDK
jgi:ATP-binding cassette subfamily F protein 1